MRLQSGVVHLPLGVDHAVGVHQFRSLGLGQIVKILHLADRLLQLGQGAGQRATLERNRLRLAGDGKARPTDRVFCVGEKIQFQRQLRATRMRDRSLKLEHRCLGLADAAAIHRPAAAALVVVDRTRHR